MAALLHDDTIAAIGTPIGAAGIGIIRLSGPDAFALADRVFVSSLGKNPSTMRSHSMAYGHIVDPDSGEEIDEVLVTVMASPHTYTTQNIVEINCHGGTVATRKTLETVLKAGARLAEPGEFTKRAFLYGRIDLAQAESVMDLINAKTEQSLKMALNQLEGSLSHKIRDCRERLLALLAHIEAGIDFPEHDIEELSRKELDQKALLLLNELEQLWSSAETGKVFREGLNTVIVGRPNVGKSSLLNALLKEKRAIVTDIPGTTRDIIEEVINIRGIPLKLVDTAGIRESDDFIEQLGVEKSRELLQKADLILLVIDASVGFTDDDRALYEQVKDKKVIFIINKSDLVPEGSPGKWKNCLGKLETMAHEPVIISALLETGLEQLEAVIEELVYEGKVSFGEGTVVTNVRHKDAIYRAMNYLREALNTLETGMPLDLTSIDIKNAWESLGEISGDTVDEDIIDRIFADFCIGK